MRTYDIDADRTEFSRLVAAAAEGERIVIARDGRPLAMLVPFVDTQETPRRKLGGMAGQFTVPADFDAPLPEDVTDRFEGA